MLKKSVVAMVVLVSVGLSSVASASNYGDTYGFSPEGMSLGNAMTARVNDWSSVYYNISGLGKTVGADYGKNELFIGYIGNAPMVDINIDRRNDSDEPLATRGDEDLETGTLVFGGTLDAGILVNLPAVISSARAGIAVAMNDDQTVIKVNDLDPRTHNFMRYGRECQKMTVMGGMGFGFMDDLFGVGLGVNSAFSGEGTVLLEHVELQTEEQSPPGQATMDLNMDQTLLFGAYFSPGKRWDSLEGLDFGFSYRADTKFEVFPFQTAASTDLGGIPLNMILALDDYYQPEIFSLGTAYSIGRFTLAFDLEYERWSGFSVSIPMQGNYGDELKSFDDILIPEFGLTYDYNDTIDILAGYYYEPSFVPDEAVTGRMNFLDNDKHVMSIGINWKLPKASFLKGNTELSAGYQLQYLVDRDVDKDAAAVTPQNPSYSYGGSCHSVMVGLSYTM